MQNVLGSFTSEVLVVPTGVFLALLDVDFFVLVRLFPVLVSFWNLFCRRALTSSTSVSPWSELLLLPLFSADDSPLSSHFHFCLEFLDASLILICLPWFWSSSLAFPGWVALAVRSLRHVTSCSNFYSSRSALVASPGVFFIFSAVLVPGWFLR